MISLFSIYVALFTPETQLQQAISLSCEGSYEQSEKILKGITPKNQDTYRFYRFLNNFRMNNQKEAKDHAEWLENFSVELPERYKVLTTLMIEEMKQWEPDDLGDIARDMQHIKDRLKNANGGKKTQKIQQEVLAKLDKLIKEKENKNNKSEAKGESQPQGGQPIPQKPLDDSKIANEGGPGTVQQLKMRKLSAAWGSLPPREQARAVQELTNGMSPRHREAIENYFRNLANNSINKK